MRANIFSIVYFLLLLVPSQTVAEPSWSSRYLKAERAGEISVCVAAVFYNNASFMVRLYGEQMDFLLRRDDFTLPYGETLGLVNLWIDGQKYQLAAVTFDRTDADRNSTAQTIQLLTKKEEYSPLFSALRYGTEAYLEFPNGTSYELSLVGSSKALAAAANCWSRNQTGPLKNNPFEGGNGGNGVAGNNPFDEL